MLPTEISQVFCPATFIIGKQLTKLAKHKQAGGGRQQWQDSDVWVSITVSHGTYSWGVDPSGIPYCFQSQPATGYQTPAVYPRKKSQPLVEIRRRLRRAWRPQTQCLQPSFNPEGHYLSGGTASILFPSISYELWSRHPGQDQVLAQNEHITHKTVKRGAQGILSSYLGNEWRSAVGYGALNICSLTHSPPTLFYVGMFITVRKTLVLPFLPWQFLFKEPLKYLVSDAYKHLLKCSFIGG